MRMVTPHVTEVRRSTLAVDFDGVIHAYSKGWQGGAIYDELVDGCTEALRQLHKRYRLVIFTARHDLGAVNDYLAEHRIAHLFEDVTNRKPMAVAYLDDRGVTFTGWAAALEALV